MFSKKKQEQQSIELLKKKEKAALIISKWLKKKIPRIREQKSDMILQEID